MVQYIMILHAEAEHKSVFEFQKATQYLTSGWLSYGMFCEDLGEYWPCYNSIALYISLATW